MFKLGDKVVLTDDAKNLDHKSLAARLGCKTWDVDIEAFISQSDINGVFTVCAREFNVLPIVQLKAYRGRVKIDWWVPVGIFKVYEPDWLEDLELASVKA